jgi:hypothetical protein
VEELQPELVCSGKNSNFSDTMPLLDPTITPIAATFLLTFGVFYFLLNKTNIFEKQKNVIVILALAISVFAASYSPLVQGLQDIFPIAVMILLILTVLFFLKDVSEKLSANEIMPTAVALATSLALVAILWDRIMPLLPFGLRSDNVLWAAGFIIIILLLYVINKQTNE